MRMQAPRQPLLPFIRMREDGLGWGVDRDDLHALFYHDCPPGTVEYAAENLCIQATRPTAEPVPLHHSLALPRYYVRCADDRTIPPEFQITMTQDWPADHVATMTCAHSPFFADPQGLADILSDFGKGH
jgi:pimeloyl-ACP methyl ester carboxylesterase